MLRVDDWQYCQSMRKEVYDYVKEQPEPHNKIGGFGKVSAELMLEIVTKPEHPLRLHMAVDFVAEYSIIQHVKSQDDVKTVRLQYNRWINRRCGFLKLAA